MTDLMRLLYLLWKWRTHSISPGDISFSKFGSIFMTTLSKDSELSNEIMDSTSTAGLASTRARATLIAMSEYLEAQAISYDEKHSIFGSEGLAAWPLYLQRKKQAYLELAKENSLNEATERFTWANWWDDVDTSYKLLQDEDVTSLIDKRSRSLLTYTESLFPNGKLIIIIPNLTNSNLKTAICLYFFQDGVLSGGACGDQGKLRNTVFRAMSELVRHGVGVHRSKYLNHRPRSFYDERLIFFGSMEGRKIAEKRLRINGDKAITLPKLKISSEIIVPKFKDLAVFYRSIYFNQPAFIGGDLKRLCL